MPKFDLLAELGWRAPIERISEQDRREGKVNLTLDDEYDTYFDADVKSELVKPESRHSFKGAWKKARYYVPIFMWLPEYKWRTMFPRDLVAGLACGAMLIPQSLAYSILAGLPPKIGLYTAWMPLIIYFFFGTSKQLSIGPDALSSILVGLLLSEGDHEDPVMVAHFLSFLSGFFLFVMGILRFGFMNSVLSRPMLSGFVNAVAIFIMCDQVDTLFGLPSGAKYGYHGPSKLSYFSDHLNDIHWGTFVLGVIGMVFLFSVRILRRKLTGRLPWIKFIPEILVLVVITIIISYTVDLNSTFGIAILKDLDAGFPVPMAPSFGGDLSRWKTAFSHAVVIGVIGFVESSVVAKIYANKHDYFVSANRELVAFGLANIFGSFFQTYPTFGSLPRSSVADTMGAQSQMFTLIASFIILISLLFLGPIFYYLPRAVMSSVIIVAAYGLLEFEDISFVWKMKGWTDMIIMLVTFCVTLFVSVEVGIMAGIGVSVLLLIKNITTSHLGILGNIPGTTRYKDIEKYPDAVKQKGILTVSVNEALYFSNVSKVKDLLARIEKLGSHVMHPGADRIEEKLKTVILVMNRVVDMDVSAIQVIHEMKESYEHRHILFCFVGLNDKFKKMFKDAGIFRLEEECVFTTVHEAVLFANELEGFTEETEEEKKRIELEVELAESALMVRTSQTKQEIPKAIESNLKKTFHLDRLRRFTEIQDEPQIQPRFTTKKKRTTTTIDLKNGDEEEEEEDGNIIPLDDLQPNSPSNKVGEMQEDPPV